MTEAIYDAGFNSGGRFTRSSDALLGMTPTDYRAGGGAYDNAFRGRGGCTLGSVLVAQSARGVCAIFLGDDPAALVRNLEERFPRATIVGGDAAFEPGCCQGRERRGGSPGIRSGCTAGRARHGVSAACMAGAATDSGRVDRKLTPILQSESMHRHQRTRGGASVRREPGGSRNTVSSGRQDGWIDLGLSLGVERKRNLLEKEGVV